MSQLAGTGKLSGVGALDALPTVNMLWIGDALGRIERLSIASWLAHGHDVRLHAYGSVAGVDRSVEVADANATLPYDAAIRLRHRSKGSFALASDCFRYRLQAAGAGLWSDSDVVCLRPVRIDGDCLYGMQDAREINGAVLYLDRDLPMLRELIDLFRDNAIPPWVPADIRRKLRFRRWLGLKVTPGHMPWGSYGPLAVTELAHKHGLFGLAQPQDVFYPLHCNSAHRLYDPAASLDEMLTPRSLTLHLWNEMLRDLRRAQPPTGSPLAELCKQFGV